MALTFNRRWLLLPIAVQSFFMQHVIQGWCPPLPVFRRLGVRTADEINTERYALKVLRGDFEKLPLKEQREETAQQTLAAIIH